MEPVLTAQDIFDQVVTGLAAQGGPALAAGDCVYRTDSGRRCAAGLVILDTEYKPEFENKRIFMLDIPRLDRFGNLLQELQSAHDNARRTDNTGDARWAIPWAIGDFRPAGIAHQLSRVARRFDLNPTSIDAAFPR